MRTRCEIKNISVRTESINRNDNFTFDKKDSADKIDGAVSMVMALAGAMTVRKTSLYARRGMEVI